MNNCTFRIIFSLIIFLLSKQINSQVWIPQNSGTTQHLNDVCFVSATQGWAVGNNGTILTTTNGGVNWTAQISGITSPLYSVSFVSPTQGWIAASNCILTTTNGGINWVNQFNPPVGTLSIHFISPLLGWACGGNGSVFRTTDGGNSWIVSSTSVTTMPNNCIFFTSSTDGFVGDLIGTIFKTTDGGVNWAVVVPGNFSSSVYDLYFLSSTHGWAPTFGPWVHRTINGGGTWNMSIANVSTPNLYGIWFTSTTIGWAVGNNGIIQTTADGGLTWSNTPSNSTNTLKSICFPTNNNGWTVGFNGTILTYTCIIPIAPSNNTPSQNLTVCSGKSATLNAQGFGNLSWYTASTGGSFLASGSTLISPALTTNTVFYVQDSICSLTSTRTAISVSVNPSPIVSTNSGSLCAGQSFTIIPSGANTYTYSSGTNIVSPTTTTSYSVVGTSINGCVSSNTVVSTITVNPLPLISAVNGTICSGQSFVISPTGANTYTYLNSGPFVFPSVSTSYSVTGTSAAGCVSATPAIVFVSVNPTPTVLVNSGAICTGDSFTIMPSGASTYTFSGGTNIVSPTITSTYFVSGTSTSSCVTQSFAISNVTVNTLPSVNAITNDSLICTGQQATLTASGANTYSWSTTSTNTIIIVSPTVNTTYTVTGTDNNNCQNTSVITQSVSLCTGFAASSGVETQQINIYPNPTSAVFNIELTNYNNTKIEIYNSIGQLIISKTAIAQLTNINLSEFANGLYILKVQSNNETISFSKIIKQ